MTRKTKPTTTKTQRKEFALAFAQLAYDVFKDKKQDNGVENQRKEVSNGPQKIRDRKL